MKYCPMCGKTNPSAALFCGMCGARFPQNTVPAKTKPFNYALAWIVSATSAVLLCAIALILA